VSTQLGATERLYYTDAYRREFEAKVVDRSDDGLRVYLDRTAFYPTSGGQPHDLGSLGGSPVVDVVDEGERIAHVLAAPVSNTAVNGRVDWPRRFDHMQQHTGQHLLSAVFEDLFKASTVSVHFGDQYSTVDLEVDSLSAHTLAKAERRANEIVAENRPVSVTFEDSRTAVNLRKGSGRDGMLRIITIGDLDRSACGGTHVRSTGEIGPILIRGTERIRRSVRVEFVCGVRAVSRARADFESLAAAAAALNTSIDSVANLVAAQASQLKDTEQARRRLDRELAGHRGAALYQRTMPASDGIRIVSLDEPATDMDTLRTLAQAVIANPRCAFEGITTEAQVVVASSEDSGLDAGKIIRELTGALGGKGGGSPRLAQASIPEERVSEGRQLIRDALARDR
jgi:alanyl-tRNA synthetase